MPTIYDEACPVSSASGSPAAPAILQGFDSGQALQPAHFFPGDGLEGVADAAHRPAQRPAFPKLTYGQVAITWIGHASFLVQFTDLNVLIDPNFANWLFLLKRIKRSGPEHRAPAAD